MKWCSLSAGLCLEDVLNSTISLFNIVLTAGDRESGLLSYYPLYLLMTLFIGQRAILASLITLQKDQNRGILMSRQNGKIISKLPSEIILRGLKWQIIFLMGTFLKQWMFKKTWHPCMWTTLEFYSQQFWRLGLIFTWTSLYRQDERNFQVRLRASTVVCWKT